MNESPRLLAAVDMGSNSFRLMIGRVDETMTASGPASQIFQSTRCASLSGWQPA